LNWSYNTIPNFPEELQQNIKLSPPLKCANDPLYFVLAAHKGGSSNPIDLTRREWNDVAIKANVQIYKY